MSRAEAPPAATETAQRLILRGGMSAALGLAIRLAARILFVFGAARLFGAALFGAYSVAVAWVELAVAVGGLGTKRILFQLLDEDRSGRSPVHIVLDAALMVLAASLVLALLTMAIAGLSFTGEAPVETSWALFVIAPMIAGQALTDLFLAATRWKHRMRYEVVGRSIAEPYGAIAVTLAAAWLGFGHSGLLIGYWGGTLAVLAYALWGVRRAFGSLGLARWRVSRAEIAEIVRVCRVPTLTDFASALFTRLDLYLVGIMLGEAPAGVYGMARQLRTPIRQVRQSFDGLLTPLIARTLTAGGTEAAGKAAASAARLILAIELPLLMAVVVIGQPFLQLLGPEFVSGYWAFILLAAAETIQGAFGVGDLILLYRRPWLALAVTFASAAVTLVAGWLLIASLGGTGAALAVLLAMSAGALVRRLALRSAMGVKVSLAYSAGPILAAAVATAAGGGVAYLLLSPGSGWVPLAFTLVAALAIYGLALRLWLSISGQRLALEHFTTG